MKDLNALIDMSLNVEAKAINYGTKANDGEYHRSFTDLDLENAFTAGARAVGEPLADALRVAIETLDYMERNMDVCNSWAEQGLQKIRAILESAQDSKAGGE